jgi:hypothetical protein
MRKLFENVNLDDSERDGRITLTRMFGNYFVRVRVGWNWQRIMSRGGLCC